MVTLGCARNEVDSEELAARLEDGGWQVADEAGDADVVLVNTCGFIQAAKQESIDELLEAAGGGAHVVAAGCLAERYGAGLAEAMPEAQILSFDDYADIAARLDSVAAGQRWAAHEPRDRRKLLPLSPADRPGSPAHLPGHGLVAAPASPGQRSEQIADLPPGVAPASGPRVHPASSGRGSRRAAQDRLWLRSPLHVLRNPGISRRLRVASPGGPLAEAGWLADHGARELILVSENSTSYGKDLGDLQTA